jgi:folate-dependent tRNA-U54 methylase TrmFO/GidA
LAGVAVKKMLVICLLGFALAGCDQQLRINGENEMTIRTSIEKIRDTLSEDKKFKFDEALSIIMFNGIDYDELFKNTQNGNVKYENIDYLETKLYKSLNNKTAEQIIHEAEELKAKKDSEMLAVPRTADKHNNSSL